MHRPALKFHGVLFTYIDLNASFATAFPRNLWAL